MGVIIKNKKLMIIAEPKTIHFDLPKYIDNNLKRRIDFITKHSEFFGCFSYNEHFKLGKI